jgi:hypothetical protein
MRSSGLERLTQTRENRKRNSLPNIVPPPVVFVVVQAPAHRGAAIGFLCIRLQNELGKNSARTAAPRPGGGVSQEEESGLYLKQAKHAGAQGDGSAGDDAFAYAAHVVAAAARARE